MQRKNWTILSRVGKPLLLVALLIALSIPAEQARSSLDHTGKWTPVTVSDTAWNWNYTAIHLLLTPGDIHDGTPHSRVVWWEGAPKFESDFDGSIWEWNPGQNDDCDSVAALGFSEVELEGAPGFNPFCGASGHLADSTGRIVMLGGTEGGEIGVKKAALLDPNNPSDPWDAIHDMGQERWYPVVTRLSNGELVVTSGSKYTLMHIFGGRPTGTSSNSNATLRRVGLSQHGEWEGNVTALPYSQFNWQWPRRVQGHSFAKAEIYRDSDALFETFLDRAAVFGGDSLNDSSQWVSTHRVHLFETVDQRLASDEGYGWTKDQPIGGDLHSNELRRAGHVMVTDGTPSDDDAKKPGWIVFGGRQRVANQPDVFLDDLWTLRWDSDALPHQYRWSQAFPDNPELAPPEGRYGAAGIFDPIHHRILIFGGSPKGIDPVADNYVYALNVSSDGELAWDRILPYAPAGRPTARFGHAMLFDTQGRRRHEDGSDESAVYFSAILHGGIDVDGYSGEMWRLWISETNPDSLVWRRVPPKDDAPVARAFHVMVRDPSDRLIIFGGDVDGSPDDEVWVSKLPFYGVGDHHFVEMRPDSFQFADLPFNSNPNSWSPDWGTLDNVTTDGSMSGAAAIAYSQPIFARIPDRYSADLSTHSAYPDSAALLENWYPFTFVIPDGSLFTCGPFQDTTARSYRQPHPSAPWKWQQYPPGAGSMGILPGSAAMYAPGKIVVAGGSDINDPANSDSRSIDLSGAEGSPTWKSPINSMRYARSEHNLVILPNGQVLAVGGVDHHKGLSPILRPEMYLPDSVSGGNRGLWYITVSGESLAKQTFVRGYHSTALLLPDGRVLSTSGNEGPDLSNVMTQHMAELYCPPYLFSGDTAAARPVITDIVRGRFDRIPRHGYSRSFWVCLSGDVSGIDDNQLKACLISPGAVTHQFDQNQRRVPLTVTSCAGSHRVAITTPADSNLAPPGYYMLFILNNKGVPSIAEWVLIGRDHESGSVACGACGGGGCPYLDVATAGGWQTENTILSRSLQGNLAFDAIRMRNVPVDRDGKLTVRIRENENEVTTLDQAKLLVVDHAPGNTVLGNGDGAVVGTLVPAHRVTFHGQEITDLVAGTEGSGGWWGSPGDTVLVELDAPQIGARASAVQEEGGGAMGGDPKEQELRYDPNLGGGPARMSPAAAPALATDADWLQQTGIIVQRQDGQGRWSEVAHWYPRQYEDRSYFPGLGHGTTRLIFVGSHRLTFLGRLATNQNSATIRELQPLTALHTRLGDVAGALALPDSSTNLAPGDTIGVSFSVPEIAQGMERDYVLVTRGVYSSSVGAHRLAPNSGGLPLRFALLQNRPNPFGDATTIQFELPVPTKVKLEIFDLMGRRVKTLVNTQTPAGYHKVEWDRRTDAGAFVHSGVFTYRITAGSFTDRRKMVLLSR